MSEKDYYRLRIEIALEKRLIPDGSLVDIWLKKAGYRKNK